jgi:excisionase family DNA binding protein
VVHYGPMQTTEVSEVSGIGQPLLLRVEEAARLLSLSRSKVYELIGSGRLRVVHVDRSLRVPMDSINEFIGSLPSTPSD